MNEKIKTPKGWKKHKPHKIMCPDAECFYQKKILDHHVEVVEYNCYYGNEDYKSWEARLQISIGERTANINLFSYREPDFELIESEITDIIKSL